MVTVIRASIVALLAMQVTAWAQPVVAPGDKPVAELLASGDPKDQAWGAYLAGNQGLKDASRELMKLAFSEDWRVRMAALDSLIRLEITIPADALEKLATRRLDEPLIFIARNLHAERPEEYGAVIESLFAKPDISDHYWVALNSILLTKPPAGFAARLLREWTIHTTLLVDDTGSAWFGTPGLGAAAGDGTRFSEWGFPPLFMYFVFENPDSRDTLIAGGSHPVGYHRQVSSSQTYYQRDRNEYRKDYLLELSRTGGDPRPLRRSHAVKWSGVQAYRKSVRETITGIRQAVEKMKARLTDAGLLTSSEAPAFPSAEIRVIDERSRKVPTLRSIKWQLSESNPKY